VRARVWLAAGATVLLAACGAQPAVNPAAQAPVQIIVSSQATATPTPLATMAPTSTPVTMDAPPPPFVQTPYLAPGPPNTISNEAAQATRTSFETKIAQVDKQIRSAITVVPPSPTATAAPAG